MKKSFIAKEKSFAKDEKMATVYRKATVYCKCGHSIVMSARREYKLCNHCGSLVFKNKKAEFKYRLNEAIAKNKRSEKSEAKEIN